MMYIKDWNWSRITDWMLGLTIFFVMVAMLTAPLWLCALVPGCEFAS